MPARTLSRSPQRVMATELRRIERVQRDVDAADPAVAQFSRETCELRAVGRQRQFVQRTAAEMARQRAHQRHHVAADQRLAAGQAQLSHALGYEGRAEPVEFLEREQIGLGEKCHVFRHAIKTPQIAAIRDRYPQIADGPAKRVGHRARQRGGRTRQRSSHFNRPCITATAAMTAAALPLLPIYASSHLHTISTLQHLVAVQCSDHRPAGGVGAGGAAAAGACCWSGNGEPAAGAGALLGGFGFFGFIALFRTGLGGGPAGCSSATTGFGSTVAGDPRSPWTSCTGMVTGWNLFKV